MFPPQKIRRFLFDSAAAAPPWRRLSPAAVGDLLPPTAIEAPSRSLVVLAGGQTASDLGLASPGKRLDHTRNDALTHMTTVGLLLLVCLVLRLCT